MTSEERREVAAMMRDIGALAEKESYDYEDVAMKIDEAIGEVQNKSWISFFDHLADLIDPTCHAVHSNTAADDELVCSECGERLGAVLPAIGMVMPPHCPHCGARVVSSGGELRGITGTEIGKYRYVSDNEDGKEG